MPALAEHLGVGVTSIYWYFRKKDDLLNAMTDGAVDTYIREMPPLPDDLPWQEVLRNPCRNSRHVHRNDQILSDLIFIRTSTYTRYATRRVFEVEEAVITSLAHPGSPPDTPFLLSHAHPI